MFGNRDNKLSTGFFEEFRPCLKVPVLGLEDRNKVLVSELGLVIPDGFVMVVNTFILEVHLPRIPLVSGRRPAGSGPGPARSRNPPG